MGMAVPLACRPAEPVPAAADVQAEALVVKVLLNGEDKGELFVARTSDRDFLVKIDDLAAMGLKAPAGKLVTLGGEPHLSLNSVRGMSFSFDEPRLVLSLTADAHLLPTQSLQVLKERKLQATPSVKSGFFNYALDFAKSGPSPSSTNFSGEAGWRGGDYLLLSNANTVQQPDGRHKLVRMMSSITRDDMDNLRRTVIGDFFTPTRDLGNGANLGGLSVSKLYALNPYLVQFPLQTVSGTVALASDLEVYLDGQRIRSEKLKPGDFELRDILAYNGARSVRLVLRDPFGRVQELDYSFYFTDQPLRDGLHEYSYNLGFMRRSYGLASNRYGPPAFTMFHRYGVSDALTLGVHAEAARSFSNAGPIATVVLGRAGVVNLALATSSLEGRRGGAASATYNYQTGNWSMSLAARRDWGRYATIGDPPIVSNRRSETSAVTSYSFPHHGVASFSHFARSARDVSSPDLQILSSLPLDSRKVTSVSYAAPLIGRRASLSASLSRIKDAQSRTEFAVRLIVFLDNDYSFAASHEGGAARHDNVQFTKSQPIGEGLGYVVQAERNSGAGATNTHGWSTLQYNAPLAIVRAEYGRREGTGPGTNDYRTSVAGGVAYVDGTVAVGRPVTGSFAIVKVGQLADVAVSVNGQAMGKTGAGGKLFVPTINSYYDNEVSIAPETVPIDYSLAATSKKVSPALRGGAVIDFGVMKIQAFSGHLAAADGASATPVEFQEFTLTVQGAARRLQTGRGGEFYIENVPPGTYPGTARVGDGPCRFDLVVPNSDETFVQLGQVRCRPGQ